MARSFTSGQLLQNNTAMDFASAGTFAFWINPTWNSGDSVNHWFFGNGRDIAGDMPRIQFQKFSNNNIYIGWYTPGTDNRLAVADTGIFASGTYKHHCYVWNTTGTSSTYYVNASQKGTSATKPSATYTDTRILCVGNYFSLLSDIPANAAIGDVAVWNVVLTVNEITALSAGIRPYMIRPKSILLYFPLDGIASPEPDLGGARKDLTLTGTPAFATAPPINMFTPRWPSNSEIVSAPGPTFVPAWVTQSNIPVIGSGIY